MRRRHPLLFWLGAFFLLRRLLRHRRRYNGRYNDRYARYGYDDDGFGRRHHRHRDYDYI